VNDTLKEGARSSTSTTSRKRFRALLVTSEIALSLVLLVGAGLMVKGFRALITHDMGFDRSHILTFHTVLSEEKYHDKDRIRGYYEQALRNIQALPGVESAACLTSVPSGWTWNWTEFTAEGAPPAAPREKSSAMAISQIVTPEFFAVLRVPLQQGRLLSDQDTSNASPVAVISDSMARQSWPGKNPLGKRIRMGRPEEGHPFRTVVGIVGDVKPNAMDHDPTPTAYVPLAQQPEAVSAFVVRTSGDPLNFAGLVSKQILSLDPAQPAYDLRSLDQVIFDGLSGIDLASRMMLVFAACALLLAAAGIFAVTAYSVTQRTHEIGVRVALGARHFDVLRLVVGGAMRTALLGLGIGLVLALLLTRAISSALFGVVQFDLITITLLTLALASVATLAAYVPARRAARVDPMVALRYE
jgi:putative ABC transport system permease protein